MCSTTQEYIANRQKALRQSTLYDLAIWSRYSNRVNCIPNIIVFATIKMKTRNFVICKHYSYSSHHLGRLGKNDQPARLNFLVYHLNIEKILNQGLSRELEFIATSDTTYRDKYQRFPWSIKGVLHTDRTRKSVVPNVRGCERQRVSGLETTPWDGARDSAVSS